MAETTDYTPSSGWENHDFKKARANYDRHAGRSYDKAKGKINAKDLLPPSISTESEYPVVIWTDHTGSMGGWPGVIFSKLPYLEHQLRTEYLGEDMEISFGAIGDTADTYTLQVRPFAKGVNIKERMEELVIESGGGGESNYHERYDIAALWLLRNVSVPKSSHPIAIFIGDEMPYEYVSKSLARKFFITMEEREITIVSIMKQLLDQWTFYFIQKPYGNQEASDEISMETRRAWGDLIGKNKVIMLPEAERVVDVIFGIMAKEQKKLAYFHQEIARRQTPKQVKAVYKALKNVLPRGEPKRLPSHSVPLLKGVSGKKAVPLLQNVQGKGDSKEKS